MADNIGYNDMMRMQSEAVQRVREMQRRAQNAVQKANAQRTSRAPEQPENKGETFKRSAPPLSNHTAKSTALPLDYLSNQPPLAPHVEKPVEQSAQPQQPREEKRRPSSSLPIFSGDVDRLLVVILILLLSQEEADELLLMALGYLIM
ncbi:MAG: hypothetical protein IKU25_01545 [Clostridia bacterium]|nr:hypothetical protein [Clostridia bacterium]